MMPWLRVDDSFHSHPKVMGLPNSAIGLWLRCATWSAEQLTDGVIPARVWQKFGRKRDHDALVDCALWLPDGDGVVMHDYLDYNPSADQVKLQRKAAAERQAKARQAAARRRGGP